MTQATPRFVLSNCHAAHDARGTITTLSPLHPPSSSLITPTTTRYLLPPVIFYAGLSVEKSRFFLALPSILMSGVFGTLASFIIISLFMYLTLGFALFKMEVSWLQGAGVCYRRAGCL